MAAAVHARRVGDAPCRLFVALLRDQRWEVITQEDEDQARRLLREHRDGPCPRTRAPATAPEVSLSDDARFMLRAEQVLRQAGWQGELFLGVKLVDPTWTRARWKQAQATLAQWQKQQGRARWQRRIRKLCMAPVPLLSVCSRRPEVFRRDEKFCRTQVHDIPFMKETL